VAAVDPSFCEVEQRLAALEDAKPEPDPGNLAIVVVGDSETIAPQLAQLGIAVKLLDEDGELIE